MGGLLRLGRILPQAAATFHCSTFVQQPAAQFGTAGGSPRRHRSVVGEERCGLFGVVPAAVVKLGRGRVAVASGALHVLMAASLSRAVVMNVARIEWAG